MNVKVRFRRCRLGDTLRLSKKRKIRPCKKKWPFPFLQAPPTPLPPPAPFPPPPPFPPPFPVV